MLSCHCNRRKPFVSRRLVITLILLLSFTLPLGTLVGCAATQRLIMGGWVANYEDAEERCANTGEPLLIYYRRNSVRRQDTMEERLSEGSVKKKTKDLVRCKLFRTHEPHRRYIAQFGVTRAPALVLLRQDGTYHAIEGLQSVEQIHEFLELKGEAGKPVAHDPLLPRSLDYSWHTQRAEAESDAEQTQRDIVYVLTASFTRQWAQIEKLFDHRDVHARYRRLTQCRLESWSPGAKDIAREAGVTDFPSIVLWRRDGSISVLETPVSHEQLCRFADGHAEKATDDSVQMP